MSYAQFHSDSEKGLGPTVASLSMGSTALMHFRRHVDMENPKAKSPYALSLILRHVSVNKEVRVIHILTCTLRFQGDVLVMDGDGVQKYYE